MTAGRRDAGGEPTGMALRPLLACALSVLLTASCSSSSASVAGSPAPAPAPEVAGASEVSPEILEPSSTSFEDGLEDSQPQQPPNGSAGDLPVAAPDGVPTLPPALRAPDARPVGDLVPGITRRTITIGIPYDPTVEERTRAEVGLDMGRGHHLKLARVLAKILNRRGGIGGRRIDIEPFVRNRRDRSYANFDAYQSDECRYFTQQTDVFAVIPQVPLDETGLSCYGRSSVSVFASTMLDVDSRVLGLGNLFTSGAIPVDVGAQTYVDSLLSQGFFGPSARVGIVSYDDPVYRAAVERNVLPLLDRGDVRVSRVAFVTHPKNRPDNNDTTVEASRTMTEFRDAGITHVLFIEGGAPWASGTFTFMAEQQRFRGFRYGLTTWMVAGTTFAGQLPAIPPQQLRGARGVGWAPLYDLTARSAADHLTRRARRWLAVARRAGIDVARCCNAQASLKLVDAILLLKRTVERAGSGGLTLESLGAAAGSARGYRPLMGLGPATRESVSYRPIAWSRGCECVRYSGRIRTARTSIR